MRSPVGSREAKGGEAKGGRERVVVAVRLRPSQRPSSVVRHDGKTVWLRDHVFSFDHVWGPDADQERVYKDVGSPILQHALRGFNGSILAYGQTGSGKTFTMLGGEDATPDRLAASAGLVPRLSAELFALLAAERQRARSTFLVSVSFLEVYNEVLRDLLLPDPHDLRAGGAGGARAPQLEIRESASSGVRVNGLTVVPVGSAVELLRAVSAGHRRRASGSTAMNARSSRSHAVFALDVLRREPDGRELRAKLSLVDLAGSERAGQVGARGEQLKEGIAINKSLSALGQVINALAETPAAQLAARAHFVPYRNSKLTRVLQGSLGGNSLTAVIGTVALEPACEGDSLSTLQYAERAKLIPVHATANEASAAAAADGGTAEARALRSQVRALQAQLLALAARAGGAAGAEDAVGRELRQRLDDTEYELKQTYEEKERYAAELARERGAEARARASARGARRRERETARQRLLGERLHGQWVRILALSEGLWLSALPELPREAAATQAALSEAELRFCQLRSFATATTAALAGQAHELEDLERERTGGASASAPRSPLHFEHATLHTLRQVTLKLDALHAESARGAELRARVEAAYARAFELLDAAAERVRESQEGWRAVPAEPAERHAPAADDDESVDAASEMLAEGLLDVGCACAELSTWASQLLTSGAQGSQLAGALSQLAHALTSAIGAQRAALPPCAARALAQQLEAAQLAGAQLRADMDAAMALASGWQAAGDEAPEGVPERLGLLSERSYLLACSLVRALEAALADSLGAQQADAPPPLPQPAGAATAAVAAHAPPSLEAASSASAAERRAARQRQRVADESGLAAPLPHLGKLALGARPTTGGGGGAAAVAAAPTSRLSGAMSADVLMVASLEERLEQTRQRLQASEEALERAAGDARALAHRLADADASRSELRVRLEQSEQDNDDLQREVVTFENELLRVQDQHAFLYNWIMDCKDNLGATDGAASPHGVGRATRIAFQLVEEKFLHYWGMQPALVHGDGAEADQPSALHSPRTSPSARLALSGMLGSPLAHAGAARAQIPRATSMDFPVPRSARLLGPAGAALGKSVSVDTPSTLPADADFDRHSLPACARASYAYAPKHD